MGKGKKKTIRTGLSSEEGSDSGEAEMSFAQQFAALEAKKHLMPPLSLDSPGHQTLPFFDDGVEIKSQLIGPPSSPPKASGTAKAIKKKPRKGSGDASKQTPAKKGGKKDGTSTDADKPKWAGGAFLKSPAPEKLPMPSQSLLASLLEFQEEQSASHLMSLLTGSASAEVRNPKDQPMAPLDAASSNLMRMLRVD